MRVRRYDDRDADVACRERNSGEERRGDELYACAPVAGSDRARGREHGRTRKTVNSDSLAIDSWIGNQPNCSEPRRQESLANTSIAGGIVATMTERTRVNRAARSPVSSTFTPTHAVPSARAASRVDEELTRAAAARANGYPGGKCDDGTCPASCTAL
jgi:hypothetical protein